MSHRQRRVGNRGTHYLQRVHNTRGVFRRILYLFILEEISLRPPYGRLPCQLRRAAQGRERPSILIYDEMGKRPGEKTGHFLGGASQVFFIDCSFTPQVLHNTLFSEPKKARSLVFWLRPPGFRKHGIM